MVARGMEGATAALERLDADAVAVAFSEVDPAANAVLRHRWPDVPRVGDTTDFDWAALRGHADLVVGGSPCASFSVAGRRLGIANPRGNLALHFLRAVGALQPRWVLYETVAGLLSSDDGRDFEAFLSELEGLGYACAWRVLDARHFGLPQRRRRVRLVAERAGDGRGPLAILDLAEGQGGAALAGRVAWKTAARRSASSVGELTPKADIDWSEAAQWLTERGASVRKRHHAPDVDLEATRLPARVYAVNVRKGGVSELSPTLQAKGNSLNSMPCGIEEHGGRLPPRRLAALECLRLQGFDDDWLDGPRLSGKFLTDPDRYRLVGNAWPVPVAAWILERLLARIMPRAQAVV